MIKESEINELSASLNVSRIAWLLACWGAELLILREATTNQTVDLTDLKEAVKMTKEEEIDAFLSKIVHGQMKTMFLANNMHVTIQLLKRGDRPHFSHGLSVNTYTEVISGSKLVAVDVKNLIAILITITKGVKVTDVIAGKCSTPSGSGAQNSGGARCRAR